MSKYIVREGMKQYKKNGLVVTKAPLFYGEADKGEGALAKVQKFLKDNQMLLILLGLGGLAAFLFRDKLGFPKKKKNPTRRRRRRSNPHCYDQNPKKRRNTKKRKNTAKKRNPTRKRRNTSTKKRKNTTKRRNKTSKAQLAARKRFVNKFAKRKNSRRRSRK